MDSEFFLDCVWRSHPKWNAVEQLKQSDFPSLAKTITTLQSPTFSVEFFPPRTARGAANWTKLVDQYVQGGPLFCDITWHVTSGLSETDDSIIRPSPTSSMTMAEVALHYCSVDTMLHLTCIGMTKSRLNKILRQAKQIGIRNILALRGDRDAKYDTTDEFKYACDLVSYIRAEYGPYFTVAVAGYPVPHPESVSPERDIFCLKHKVDAGADFIITQMFFCCEDFFRFVARCREAGIDVPIIPGICAINTYDSLLKFARLSGVTIPKELLELLEPVKTDPEAVRERGISFLTKLCRDLLQQVNRLHFYTLNKDAMIQVIKNLGLWSETPPARVVSWIPAVHRRRIEESIRPVFWCRRPRSYIHRTKNWNTFGVHWPAICSDQLNGSNLDDYYDFLEVSLNGQTENVLAKCCHYEDVYQWFHQYYSLARFDMCDEKNNNVCDDDHQVKSVLVLPWIQSSDAYSFEHLFRKYGSYLRLGLMVINYLPWFYDATSDYSKDNQKHYIEFFIEPKLWTRLEAILPNHQVLFNVSNKDASFTSDNYPEESVVPVSRNLMKYWSPISQSIMQSYIAEKRTFNVWRQEAFALFDTVIIKAEKNIGPDATKLFQQIRDNFLLVSLLDQNTEVLSDQFDDIFQKLFQ